MKARPLVLIAVDDWRKGEIAASAALLTMCFIVLVLITLMPSSSINHIQKFSLIFLCVLFLGGSAYGFFFSPAFRRFYNGGWPSDTIIHSLVRMKKEWSQYFEGTVYFESPIVYIGNIDNRLFGRTGSEYCYGLVKGSVICEGHSEIRGYFVSHYWFGRLSQSPKQYPWEALALFISGDLPLILQKIDRIHGEFCKHVSDMGLDIDEDHVKADPIEFSPLKEFMKLPHVLRV